MQCYLLLIVLIILLCFQVELDWFAEAAAVIQLCRPRWPYVDVCRATHGTRHVHFPNLGDIRMACYRTSGRAVPAEQRHRGSLSSGIPCGAAVAGRRVGVLSSLATIWNRIAVANLSSKSRLLLTWSRKGRYWVIEQCVRIENKGTRNLFKTFIRFINILI